MLDRIIARKRREVEQLRQTFKPSEPLVKSFNGNVYETLQQQYEGRIGIIAELKKASPTQGILRAELDAPKLAQQYIANGAAALSVLTEAEFFQGSTQNLFQLSQLATIPIMRKDFIIDELQLEETKCLGADMILLIAAVLSYRELLGFCERSLELGIEPLLELHLGDEADLLKDLPVRIVGINNRNLRDFSVSIKHSLEMADKLPDGLIRVSESGIHSQDDLRLLEEYGFHLALIGEALVIAEDPGIRLAELLRKEDVH